MECPGIGICARGVKTEQNILNQLNFIYWCKMSISCFEALYSLSLYFYCLTVCLEFLCWLSNSTIMPTGKPWLLYIVRHGSWSEFGHSIL